MTLLRESLHSNSLFLVLAAVISGRDYSASLARSLHYSQSAAVQNLKKLQKAGLLLSRRTGVVIKYSPNWQKLAEVWLDLAGKRKRDDTRALTIAMRGLNTQTMPLSKIHYPPEDELKKLKTDRNFISFVRQYLRVVSILQGELHLGTRNYSLDFIMGDYYSFHVLPKMHLLFNPLTLLGEFVNRDSPMGLVRSGGGVIEFESYLTAIVLNELVGVTPQENHQFGGGNDFSALEISEEAIKRVDENISLSSLKAWPESKKKDLTDDEIRQKIMEKLKEVFEKKYEKS